MWLQTLAMALSLTLTHGALTCSPEQYEFTDGGKERCCKRCPPGQELVKRCQGNQETQCQPCKSNYFSEKYNYDWCSKCSTCNENFGSRTMKKCTPTSNAVCRCADGTTADNPENTACRCPKGNQLVNKTSCIPCAEGYFSQKDDGKCMPWTNCTAQGRETLKNGTRVMDAVCGKNSIITSTFSVEPPRAETTVFTSARSATHGVHNISHSTNGSLTPTVPTHWSEIERIGCSFFLFIMGLILLGIAGVIILLMILQNCKKKHTPILQGLQGRKSCRIPVQEEHTSLNKV
uniref:Tumor necrosis factor receptor superfamily member 4 isoform X2 n=1 Tax=Geotrypetes seraphini TaxID=260995 RepID=A0A6P8PSV9_GEOSA|nr:tumor necrosis factor receptor superfamily member 4 isoform X2 [Geotrypetes seraphini]